MTTKMAIIVTLYGDVDGCALLEEVKHWNATVVELPTRTILTAVIDVREPIVEYIFQTCYKYSSKLEVTAKPVVE